MRAIQVRLRPQAETLLPSLSSLRRIFAPFSSPTPSSSDSDPRARVASSFFDEYQGSSEVYRDALKFQRPTTVKWRPEFSNSASFIGTVTRPLTQISARNEGLLAYTILRVRNLSQSKESFWILLHMRDKMAEMCFKHLRENDFIYVSGHLGTYTKADHNGINRLLFKIAVKELNFVASRHRNNGELQSGGLTRLQRYNNRLHLWQVFFSSPYEWWDNRKSKINTNYPDFKHKDTGEALWLSPNDPPWINKQLQLLDSKMAEQGQTGPRGGRSRVAKWEYDG